jgi:hypothetical protein
MHIGQTGDVSARPSQARNQAGLDWIVAHDHDHRNIEQSRALCACRRFLDDRGEIAAERKDHVGLEAYQFIRELGNARVVSRGIAVLEADGLAIDVAECFETANARINHREIGLGKEEDANARDALCLLRARRERPCRRHAASEPDEITPLHVRHGFLPIPPRR